MSNDAIAAALDAAVRKRCSTATGRTVKMLAAGIGASPDAVQQWMSGRAKVPAWAIAAMARWFGDGQFLGDVFGSGASTTPTPVAPAGGDLCLWISPAGTLHHAPLGHSQFVTAALGADGIPGDIAAHAIRMRGWIAVTLRPDGHMTLRLAASRARPAAMQRALSMLAEPRGLMAGLVVELVAGQAMTVHDCDTVAHARRLIERIAAAAVMGRPTTVKLDAERRRVGVAAAPAMVAANRGWDGPDTDAEQLLAVIGAAAGTGLAALFLAQPDGYVCQDLGASLRVDQAVVGRRLRDLHDPLYWPMVERHYDVALDEGPTLHRISVATPADDCLYDRGAWPVVHRGQPAVLTVSHLIRPPVEAVLQ